MVAPMTPRNYRSRIPRGSPSWNSPGRFNKSFSSPPSSKRPSPTSSNNFASSKCFEPPTPEALPRPPLNWVQKADNMGVVSGGVSSNEVVIFTPEEFFGSKGGA